MSNSDLFFGFDLSTQQLKLLVIDSNLQIHSNYHVEFDKDLPHYKTSKGVYSNKATGEIYSSVLLWIEAIDLILSKLVDDKFPFDRVKGISGSCQQHGSVYWSSKAEQTLSNLSPDKSLIDQISIENAFSIGTSPNWQDHSTGEEIKIFESYVGGSERLAELTGSRAHYRFTGPQIRKIVDQNYELYSNTHKISLVSSFLASVLLGKLTNIEESDACGMNLYDISKKEWNDELLSIATKTHVNDGTTDLLERSTKVEELKQKLGSVVKVGYESIGSISTYYQSKYGFSEDCKIFPFTGDNLATILALPLNQDEILISLGTSTTVLLVTKNYLPSSNYHIFIHPTIPDAYMGMICYCNGSLAREKIRDALDGTSNDWSNFNKILDSNDEFDNKLGIYFPLGEIVPNAKPQTIRGKFNPTTGKVEIVENWDVELDVNSIVESQALSCRIRSSPMLSIRQSENVLTIPDLTFDEKVIPSTSLVQRPNKAIFVGGASKNLSIVKKFGSILGAIEGNYKYDNSNACAIGGAFKALWSFESSQVELKGEKHLGFHEFLTEKFQWKDLEEIKVKDEWLNYRNGLLALNQLENLLE